MKKINNPRWIYCQDSNNKFVLVRSHYRLKNRKLEFIHAYYRAKWGTKML